MLTVFRWHKVAIISLSFLFSFCLLIYLFCHLSQLFLLHLSTIAFFPSHLSYLAHFRISRKALLTLVYLPHCTHMGWWWEGGSKGRTLQKHPNMPFHSISPTCSIETFFLLLFSSSQLTFFKKCFWTWIMHLDFFLYQGSRKRRRGEDQSRLCAAQWGIAECIPQLGGLKGREWVHCVI